MADHHYWYTAPVAGDNVFTGNRILAPDARGGFPNDVDYFDVELPSDIKWLVATSPSSGPQIVATTEDGSAYTVNGDGDVEEMLNYPITFDGHNPDQPPLVLSYDDETPSPVTKIVELPASANLSSLSHPVPIIFSSTYQQSSGIDIYVYIDTSNNIILYDLAAEQKLGEITNVDVLPDARIVMAPTNTLNGDDAKSKLLAVYGGSTAFSHCVLGDCTEGSTLLFIQVTQNDDNSHTMTLERQITLASGTVFEGLSPMFIENGETIATTVANSSNGAWLRTYDVFCGDIVSESAYIGWGWRHMLFYNDFAPVGDSNGPKHSMVDVLTPHVRKQLQFFDIAAGSTMEMRASTASYTTHDIGWRYLDTALSGDLNGDGINEAILFDASLRNLVSFQLVNGNTLQEVWSLPLDGKLSSNIAAVSFGSGIALAAASGRKIRVWISQSTGVAATSQDLVLQSSTSSTASVSATTTPAITSATTVAPSLGTLPMETTTGATIPESAAASATTTSAATTSSLDMLSSTTSTAQEPFASNDELSPDNSSYGTKNCSAQTNMATESGISSLTLALVMLLARY